MFKVCSSLNKSDGWFGSVHMIKVLSIVRSYMLSRAHHDIYPQHTSHTSTTNHAIQQHLIHASNPPPLHTPLLLPRTNRTNHACCSLASRVGRPKGSTMGITGYALRTLSKAVGSRPTDPPRMEFRTFRLKDSMFLRRSSAASLLSGSEGLGSRKRY